jgi:hypothetical protein
MQQTWVRSERGSVAHHPSCRVLARRRTGGLVPAGRGDALCAHCAPTCLVCMDARGRPTGCARGHGLCDECAVAHVARHVAWAVPVRCPCGGPHALDVRLLPDAAFQAWQDGLRRAATPSAPPVFAGVVEALCTDARGRRCPHCHRLFADYDGCAAVQCVCGGLFCALCLEGFADEVEAHAHVRSCLHRPDGGGDYFVRADDVARVWLGRARHRLRALLTRVRERDGVLLAWCVRRAVRRFDPELLTPPWTWREMVCAMFAGGVLGALWQVDRS